MIDYVTIAGMAFTFVALKCFQQLNVVNYKWFWVPPVSYSLAWADVYIVHQIATYGPSAGLVFSLGTGGFIGCLLSMALHKYLMGREDGLG